VKYLAEPLQHKATEFKSSYYLLPTTVQFSS